MPHNLSHKKYIFIIGLHRSGTSLLADYLKEHPDVSGFENTEFPKDEGQFLQTVFPIAAAYGGPGKFGFDKRSHLTEISDLLNEGSIKKLHNEWNNHWDMSKTYLLEKSPPSILKTRFLQKVFPNSYFILIKRDPIAVSYATQKWSKTSIKSLLNHWLTCHNIFLDDSKYLTNLYSISYEDLVSDPLDTIDGIYNFVGLNNPIEHKTNLTTKVNKSINNKYFQMWLKDYKEMTWLKKIDIKIFSTRFKKFKYSLKVKQ